jgi:hypothetical protein
MIRKSRMTAHILREANHRVNIAVLTSTRARRDPVTIQLRWALVVAVPTLRDLIAVALTRHDLIRIMIPLAPGRTRVMKVHTIAPQDTAPQGDQEDGLGVIFPTLLVLIRQIPLIRLLIDPVIIKGMIYPSRMILF